MEELWAFILVIIQAPIAIFRGRFNVDKRRAIYGWPARVVGVLLLVGVVTMPLLPLFWLEEVATAEGWMTELLLAHIALFIGGIFVSALLCVVFRERRRDLPPPVYDSCYEDE